MISILPMSWTSQRALFGNGAKQGPVLLERCNRQIKPLTTEEAQDLVRQPSQHLMLLDEEKFIALNYRLSLEACMKGQMPSSSVRSTRKNNRNHSFDVENYFVGEQDIQEQMLA